MPRSVEGALEARSSAVAVVADDELERAVRYHRILRRATRLVIEGALLVALLALFFVRFPQVEGRSMQPSIEQGYHVLINTLAYEIRVGSLNVKRQAIIRGDIVAFQRQDDDTQKTFLKRVVALPGESVAIENGTVLVNGVPLPEPYRAMPDASNFARALIPPGSVFVMGDNRAESDDSRAFGAVPTSSIIGKAVLVIWPLGHVRLIQ